MFDLKKQIEKKGFNNFKYITNHDESCMFGATSLPIYII